MNWEEIFAARLTDESLRFSLDKEFLQIRK